MALDMASFMDPGTLGSIFSFGLVVVVFCVLLYIVSMFSMRETSFEDVLAEQKRAKEKEEKERAKINKQKRENLKKKFDKKKKVQDSGAGNMAPKAPKPLEAKPAPVAPVKKAEPAPVKKQEVPVKKQEVAPVKQENVPPKKQEPSKKVQPAPTKKSEAAQAKEKQASKKSDKGGPVSILKTEPAKPKQVKEEPKQSLTGASKQEKKSKKSDKEEVAGNRKRSVSFSDEIEKKVDNDADKKKKKGKKNSQPQQEMNEHPIITSLKDVTFESADVQTLLDHLKRKYDVAVGNPNKEAVMKNQLNKKEEALQQSMSRCMAAEKKIDQLTQDIVLEKTKLMSLEKSKKEEQGKIELQHRKEIEQLKVKLLQVGDVDILKKRILNLETENQIFKAEVEKNAKSAGERNRQAGELSNVTAKLSESLRRNAELEEKVKSLAMQVDQTNKQKVEIQRQLTLTTSQHEQQMAEVTMEFNKTKHELQTSRENSASIHEQMAVVNESMQKAENWEGKFKELTNSCAQLESEKQELQLSNQTYSKKINSLQSDFNQLKDENKKLLENSQGAMQSQQADFHALEEALKASEANREASKAELEEKTTELTKQKEELDKLKKKNNELRERNWKAMDAVSALEKSSNDKLKDEQNKSKIHLNQLQDEVKNALNKAFPDVSCSHQNFTEYLNTVLTEASSLQTTEIVSVEGPELKAANAKIDELQSALDGKSSENSNLQNQVEALQQSLNGALDRSKQREQSVTQHDEVIENLKQESINAKEELEKYKIIVQSTEDILSKLQSSVETEESVWRKKVEEAHVDAQNAKKGAEELRVAIEKLSAENTSLQEFACQNQQLTNEITKLKEDLKKSQNISNANGDINSEGTALQNGYLADENEKLKERLEKEKQMTKNLGQAATKLQTVLKQTQEQLNKEREKNRQLSDGAVEQTPSTEL